MQYKMDPDSLSLHQGNTPTHQAFKASKTLFLTIVLFLPFFQELVSPPPALWLIEATLHERQPDPPHIHATPIETYHPSMNLFSSPQEFLSIVPRAYWDLTDHRGGIIGPCLTTNSYPHLHLHTARYKGPPYPHSFIINFFVFEVLSQAVLPPNLDSCRPPIDPSITTKG